MPKSWKKAGRVAHPDHKGKDGEHIDGWMAEYIAAQKGKPFFINFWMYSAHCP